MNDTQKIIKYLAISLGLFLTIAIIYSICYAAYSIFSTFIVEVDKNKIKLEDKHTDLNNYIDIDLYNTNLNISLGDSINIDNSSDYIGVYQSNNKIVIKEKKHVSLKKNKNTIDITIPKNIIFDAIYIDGGKGNINIEDLTTNYLELDLGSGNLIMNNINTLEDTTIDGGKGSIELNNCIFNNSDIELGAGKLLFSGKLLGKNKIDTGVGSVNINLLDNINNYKIKFDNGIGNSYINNTPIKDNESYGNGNNHIDISGGIGEIKVTTNS